MQMLQVSEHSMDAESILRSARLLQSDIDKSGVGRTFGSTPVRTQNLPSLYDVIVTSKDLRNTTRKLFLDGHYARAVEEAYKCINNTVKEKSRLIADGQDLMNRAFSEKNQSSS